MGRVAYRHTHTRTHTHTSSRFIRVAFVAFDSRHDQSIRKRTKKRNDNTHDGHHTPTCIYAAVYTCMCVCVCVCAKSRTMREPERTCLELMGQGNGMEELVFLFLLMLLLLLLLLRKTRRALVRDGAHGQTKGRPQMYWRKSAMLSSAHTYARMDK